MWQFPLSIQIQENNMDGQWSHSPLKERWFNDLFICKTPYFHVVWSSLRGLVRNLMNRLDPRPAKGTGLEAAWHLTLGGWKITVWCSPLKSMPPLNISFLKEIRIQSKWKVNIQLNTFVHSKTPATTLRWLGMCAAGNSAFLLGKGPKGPKSSGSGRVDWWLFWTKVK